MNKRTYSGTTSAAETQQEKEHRLLARAVAAEGFVLLKNEGVLPLDRSKKIALLGGGACKTVKGGTGSGDVNEREVVSIWEGLKNAGFAITSEDWLADYQNRYDAARQAWKEGVMHRYQVEGMDFFGAYTCQAFRYPSGRTICAADVEGAQTAVYVISRIAGEGADRHNERGDYLLSQAEVQDLQLLCSLRQNVVVLLNTGAQVDMQEILSFPQVRGVVYLVQPGMEAGNAVADVLSGDVNFSGKLTDTWAKTYADFPNSASFSHCNGNVEQEEYREDIYVGYRYFDTFQVEPEYSFGFGLSYTRFATRFQSLTTDGAQVTVRFTVENTGSTAGKEVAQIYASCPQTGLPKERRRLCGFAKTRLLQPGQVQELTVSFPVKGLASFEEARGAWLLEKGTYGVWLGNSLADAALCAAVSVAEETVLETVPHICSLQQELQTMAHPGAAAFEAQWHSVLAENKLPVSL